MRQHIVANVLLLAVMAVVVMGQEEDTTAPIITQLDDITVSTDQDTAQVGSYTIDGGMPTSF